MKVVFGKDEEQKKVELEQLQEAQIMRSLTTWITCVICVFVGNTPQEVGRVKVKSTKRTFRFAKETYIVDGKKTILVKPWHYFISKNYVSFSFYEVHKDLPLSLYESKISEDADLQGRVMNVANNPTLLPNNNQILEMITLAAIAIAIIGVGLSAYLIADPNGSENLRKLAEFNRSQQQANKPTPNAPNIPTTPPGR